MNPLAICAEKTRFNESVIFSDHYTPIHHLFDTDNASVIACVDRDRLTKVAVSIHHFDDRFGIDGLKQLMFERIANSKAYTFEHPNITKCLGMFLDTSINKYFCVSEMPVDACTVSNFREFYLENDKQAICGSVLSATGQLKNLLHDMEEAGLVLTKPIPELSVMVQVEGKLPRGFKLIIMRDLLRDMKDVEPKHRYTRSSEVATFFYGMDPDVFMFGNVDELAVEDETPAAVEEEAPVQVPQTMQEMVSSTMASEPIGFQFARAIKQKLSDVARSIVAEIGSDASVAEKAEKTDEPTESPFGRVMHRQWGSLVDLETEKIDEAFVLTAKLNTETSASHNDQDDDAVSVHTAVETEDEIQQQGPVESATTIEVDDEVRSEYAFDHVSESQTDNKDEAVTENNDKSIEIIRTVLHQFDNLVASKTVEVDEDVRSEYAFDYQSESQTKNEDDTASVHTAIEAEDKAVSEKNDEPVGSQFARAVRQLGNVESSTTVEVDDEEVCSEYEFDYESEYQAEDEDDTASVHTAVEAEDEPVTEKIDEPIGSQFARAMQRNLGNAESSTTVEVDDDEVCSEYSFDYESEYQAEDDDDTASVHTAIETEDDAVAEAVVSENAQNADAAVEMDVTQDCDDDTDAVSVHTAIEEEEKEKDTIQHENIDDIMSVEEYINSLPETDESIHENSKFGLKVRNLGLESKLLFDQHRNQVLQVVDAKCTYFGIKNMPDSVIALLFDGDDLVALLHGQRTYHHVKSLPVNVASYLCLAKNLVNTVYDNKVLLTAHFKKLDATLDVSRDGMVTLRCDPYDVVYFSPKKMDDVKCGLFLNDITYGNALKKFMMLPFNVTKCSVIEVE